MDIEIYFEPVDIEEYDFSDNTSRGRLRNLINIYTGKNDFPDLQANDIALLGVMEDRRSLANEGCASAPDYVRRHFYNLFAGNYKVKIADLGNIMMGHSVEDTYFALSNAIKELIKQNVVPVIIGGSQDLSYANYQAYEDLGQIINIVSIDPEFDIGEGDAEVDARSYLSKIIMHKPNFLFNYSNIGYQTYLVDQEAISLMKNLFFDAYRLGFVHSQMEEVEPIVRNADMISFDISAIRHSDAPGNANLIPNGFYGEEACQITRYAGMSDKLSSIGFYELNPEFDPRGQTASLVSQMIWYFVEGYYNRKHEKPHNDKRHFVKYHVNVKDPYEEMIFYKSKKSDRWWMEVPIQSQQKMKYKRHQLVPCSYKDYQTACENDIPDRWWQAYQKLM